MTRRGLPQAIALVVVGTIVLLGFLLGNIPANDSRASHSSYSPYDDGRLAVYLILRELGFTPRAWREAPGELPRGRVCLWLPDAPDEPPEYLQRLWGGLGFE